MVTRRILLAGSVAATLSRAANEPPVRKGKVVRLFRSPDGHPNALETVPEGVWVGEQVTDRAYLMRWDGKVLQRVDTESSNTSGIAFGAGSLWMAANGKALWREPKPTDSTTGAILRVDPRSGKTLARHEVPGGGGVHGLEFAGNTLWITSLKLQKLSQVDPESWKVLKQIPCRLGRAHGLGFTGPHIWCMFSNDRQIHKISIEDGSVAEIIQLAADDPDPHGMCFHAGHLYYCDAGIAPNAKPNNSPHAGWVCRIDPA